MKPLLLKLLIFCGLTIAWLSANRYFEEYRFLRRDFLLLTVIEERVNQKRQAKYGFVLGTSLFAVGMAGLVLQKRRAA